MLEVMTLPSKEVLVFHEKVEPWIIDGKIESNKVTYILKKSTPNEIIKLFHQLKNKLPYQSDGICERN